MRVMRPLHHGPRPNHFAVAVLVLATVTAHAESRVAGQDGRAHARMRFQVVIPPSMTLDLTAAAHGPWVAKVRGNHGNTVVMKERDARHERRVTWVYTALAL